MTRALIIGDNERSAARKVIEHAMRTENYYRPVPTAPAPGEDPNFTTHIGSYRCVFTITESQGTWRHLSVSVPVQGKLPHPVAVEEIAHLFGIQGHITDWIRAGHVFPNEYENCIVVISEFMS